MARNEGEREDLMREATALVERIEIAIAEFDEPIVIGFRRNGSGSIYVGQDPAFHFNADDQLRRAFLGGQLIKAQNGQLIALHRERTAHETVLVASVTDDVPIRDEVVKTIRFIHIALEEVRVTIRAVVSADEGMLLKRIRDWLARLLGGINIAAEPNA